MITSHLLTLARLLSLICFLSILSLLIPKTVKAQSRDEKPLHFLVLGGTGTGEQGQKDVAAAMARYVASSAPNRPVSFVVLTGDNFGESGISSTGDRQWQTKFEQVYDREKLNFPFLAVLGDRDWLRDPIAQIAYGRANSGTRWQMDGFWFKRQFFGGAEVLSGTVFGATPLADFFFIDTNLFNPANGATGLGDKQLAWLTEQLKNSRARWRFVVGHHPLYSDGEHGRDADVQNLQKLLAPLLAQYRVDVYLCGHDSDLQRNDPPDHPTLFLVSGAGGGKPGGKKFNSYGPFHASTPGFAAITLTPTELRGQFIGADGTVLDEWKRSPLAGASAAAILTPPAAPAGAPTGAAALPR